MGELLQKPKCQNWGFPVPVAIWKGKAFLFAYIHRFYGGLST